MSTLATSLLSSPLANRVFTEKQLAETLGGSDARRYALVNRALKDGSLVRLKRGAYLLAAQRSSAALYPFCVAQALVPGSYVSFETALAHHGWIPEAVYATASVTPGRKTLEHNTPVMGRFSYHPLALQPYGHLVAVERQTFGGLVAFVASPLRALVDLVALRKHGWTGLEWLTSGLRIDEAQLHSLRRKDISRLKTVYKHKAVNAFINELEKALVAPLLSESDRP